MYGATVGARRYTFADLKALLAKATPLRSGDQLAGLAAGSGEERVAAQYALADLPLAVFLQEHVVPYVVEPAGAGSRFTFALRYRMTVPGVSKPFDALLKWANRRGFDRLHAMFELP